MASERARQAALRVAAKLLAAKQGGYYTHAWYSQVRRLDVEVLLQEVLNPEEAAIFRRQIEQVEHEGGGKARLGAV